MKFRDFEKYEIYPDGRIWSYNTNRFLKPQTDRNGYQRVKLSDNEGNIKWYYVHRVVYESVTREPIPKGFDVNHITEDKTDSRFESLNLMSHKDNLNFGTRNSRISKSNTNNPKRSKQVCAYRNGELVFTFPSKREAQRQGFDKGYVSKCCNGKLTHYKGFEWRYI